MGVTSYYTVNGEIIGENGPNGRIDYQVDALGSVVGTMNSSGSAQRVYRYKPYGAVLNDSGLGPEPVLRWVGTSGYMMTSLNHAEYYVRARHYSVSEGRWTSLDPLWPGEPAYTYVMMSPVSRSDPSGLFTRCFDYKAVVYIKCSNGYSNTFCNGDYVCDTCKDKSGKLLGCTGTGTFSMTNTDGSLGYTILTSTCMCDLGSTVTVADCAQDLSGAVSEVRSFMTLRTENGTKCTGSVSTTTKTQFGGRCATLCPCTGSYATYPLAGICS